MRAVPAPAFPAFYTRYLAVGTLELAEGREHPRVSTAANTCWKRRWPLDYAFIRAWQADEVGNFCFRRAQRNFNPAHGDGGAASRSSRSRRTSCPRGAIDPTTCTSASSTSAPVKVPPAPEGWWPMRPAEVARSLKVKAYREAAKAMSLWRVAVQIRRINWRCAPGEISGRPRRTNFPPNPIRSSK